MVNEDEWNEVQIVLFQNGYVWVHWNSEPKNEIKKLEYHNFRWIKIRDKTIYLTDAIYYENWSPSHNYITAKKFIRKHKLEKLKKLE